MSHAAMPILQKICNNIIHPSMPIMSPDVQVAMITFSWFSPRSSRYHTPSSPPEIHQGIMVLLFGITGPDSPKLKDNRDQEEW